VDRSDPHGLEPRARAADWIAVAAGALGALMASLDISITNSALPQIQGKIGATGTEGTWISTGYLMSEIVMIPLAAWLTRVFGLRRFLLGNAVLFIAFSMLCGVSHSLAQMVIGRIGQGFAGGAMIPTAQTIVATRLPRRQMPIGMTIFGLVVLLGPMLGPTVGGWLTENLDWSWCFFLNLPVSIALMVLLRVGLPGERTDWRRFFHADWLGISGLTIGLSSLTVLLEEGQREQWYESPMIVWLSVAAAAGIGLLVAGQFRASKPIVKLGLLGNPRYASVIVIVFTIGAGMYCMSYLLPQFLSNIAGYNAQQSGAVMLLYGIPAFLMAPVLPRLLGRVDMRVLVIGGLLCFGASCLLDVALTAQSVGSDFTGSQLLRGVGQMMAMMPLNQASLGAVAKEDAGDAVGLYNMARNLGGSVGLALLGVLIDRRYAFHDAVIRESLSGNSSTGQTYLATTVQGLMQQHADAAYAQVQALGQLAAQIQREAMVMTYSEAFHMLAIALLLCIPLACLLRRPAPGVASADLH